ncbi:MAG: tRNA (adenosine(37)-N6)-threonylcarbamoyltransferase complex ATPase subunit type 1 TsaE [Synergistaceae bacterium]|jgi:tRNA threonylcarbamoyladenosine biosynthesis protein TsaE|nr:tRNA (adenosine(37)-N6)-threonylcarbamoyltransferase complex ATPase subunit type 1 TsaE [Synergistaceae bacterium]
MTGSASFSCRTSSGEETLCLGRALGRLLVPGITVLLYGDLGTGKTVLVRGVGEALGAGRVRSPSFTLVNEYRTKTLELVHVDLYRLDPEGVDDLALEEYRDRVLLVEWPERWIGSPRDEILKVEITADDETGRTFVFSSSGPKAGRVLEEFAASAEVESARRGLL